MDYKRLELYVWWTCNQKCTYCIETSPMEDNWNRKISKYDILKFLLKYKLLWYNHVTYLWWEPFIQPVFLDALKLWKKLGYTILVTTNATTLHIDSQAKKFLSFIDELFLSVEAIEINNQQKISRTKNYVHWEKVFENIDKYWKWTYLKANIVITQDNKKELFNLVVYLHKKWIKNIALTYPDIDYKFFWKKYIKKYVAPSYKELMDELILIVKFCNTNNINIKIVDFPFCVFPIKYMEDFIKITDDFDYETRIKINVYWEELDRKFILPRNRVHLKKCEKCKYIKKCWGASKFYKYLYTEKEINPIEKWNI